MKNTITRLLSVLLLASITAHAQIAVNDTGADPHQSAMLDVSSNEMGVLFPRMTSTERMNITPLAAGLMVFDTDHNMLMYYSGTEWKKFSVGHLWSETAGGNTWLTNYNDPVGIGTKYPTGDLDVLDSTSSAMISIISKANHASLAINKYRETDKGMIVWQRDGFERWYSGLNSSDDYSISRTVSPDGTFFIHRPTGNVGIGTINPIRDLHIVGDPALSSVLISPTQVVSGGSSEILLAEDLDFTFGVQLKYDGTSNTFHIFGYDGIEYLGPHFTVERSGDIGIGIDNPTYPLHVYSNDENAAYFETVTSGTPVVIEQHAYEEMLVGYGPNGGSKEISIDYNGQIEIYNSNAHKTIDIDPSETGTDDGGQITLYNAGGTAATIEIDGSYGGDGRITTNELQITGGSDLSELFKLSDYHLIEKGMIVCIDSKNEGSLCISSKPYDKTVAGIISGANDIETGLIMSQDGSIADGEHLVALTGRVYCLVDADISPVEAGDLLTTSPTPGHAMKAKNKRKANGAIIGKAMSSLDEGKGLVLVLVSLQ